MCSLKSKLRISLLVFTLLFNINSDAACTEGSDQVVCSSIKDIEDGEKQTNWKVVEVLSNTKQEIGSDTFKNIPDVERLVFNGAVNKINRNGFKDLHKLHSMDFHNNDLLELNSNIFANVPVVVILIYTSNVKKLKVRSFDNLPNLRRVFIHKNSISNIPAGVFSFTNIEFLFLNDNEIQTIEEEAFYGMEKLIKLALEANFLTSFDSNLYVGNTSPNLSLLWLARNNLTKLTRDILSPFPNMKVLLIHINNIDSIEEGSFNGLNNLRYIDISNNKLETLSTRVFPWEGLQNLDILFLQNNRFIYLSTDIISKFPRLSRIALGGNPWLCPCYQELRSFLLRKEITLLCDDEYLAGKRPVCVSPLIKTDKCTPNQESVKKLYDFYFNAQMDYLKLPPLCKVFCGNTSCYSHGFDVLEYN